MGCILVQGDFNAYTNNKPDFVSHDNHFHSNQDDLHYVHDQNMPRNNLDLKLLNNSGKYLLNLCKESGLRLLNGRTTGDLHGKFTCFTYNGCSVVDYMLVCKDLINLICEFNVHNLTSLSNHCILSCSLLACFIPQKKQLPLDPIPNKFVWSCEAINLYIKNTNSKESCIKLKSFIDINFNNVDLALSAFNSILYDNAAKSAKLVRRPRHILKNIRSLKENLGSQNLVKNFMYLSKIMKN